jgi:hypothetical protein
LSLFLARPPTLGLRRRDSWESLRGVKSLSVLLDECGRMDDIMLGDGETGKVVASMILVGTPIDVSFPGHQSRVL